MAVGKRPSYLKRQKEQQRLARADAQVFAARLEAQFAEVQLTGPGTAHAEQDPPTPGRKQLHRSAIHQQVLQKLAADEGSAPRRESQPLQRRLDHHFPLLPGRGRRSSG